MPLRLWGGIQAHSLNYCRYERDDVVPLQSSPRKKTGAATNWSPMMIGVGRIGS